MNATTTRRAASGANFVEYGLSVFSAMAMGYTNWDDATAPAFGGVALTGTTLPQGGVSTGGINFQVVVPAGQTPASGTYTDTVVLTTTF